NRGYGVLPNDEIVGAASGGPSVTARSATARNNVNTPRVGFCVPGGEADTDIACSAPAGRRSIGKPAYDRLAPPKATVNGAYSARLLNSATSTSTLSVPRLLI